MPTRFAPSPTGFLHLGHAYSALVASERARTAGDRFLLRIEDTDRARVRSEYEAAIYEDLAWLGLDWERPVLRQSDHLADYEAALARLVGMGVTYPCRCTRADTQAALAAPQEGAGSRLTDAAVYPGTCRGRDHTERGSGEALRLDMARALHLLRDKGGLEFTETGAAHKGRHRIDPGWMVSRVGDFVLARKDIGAASYHLAVVVDDARQGITEVTRGLDLFEATFVHRLLQALLDLPTPDYHHHRLIRDENAKRLAKRDDARAIRAYRDQGLGPADIRRLVGL
jgi:glutamyl-Q tRNA(Asp) synthetase